MVTVYIVCKGREKVNAFCYSLREVLHMATIRDVARAAGVSIATVSRVINRTAHTVNEATRARVLEAVQELNYTPNAVAKSLSTSRVDTIGVIIPDISNPYYAEIVRGIQDGAEEAGYTVIIQNTDRSVQKTVRGINLFRERMADGVIFGGGVLPAAEAEHAMAGQKFRAVVIGRQQVCFPAVRIDNVAASVDAVRHLASLGHTRIAFFPGPRGSTTMEDRLQGYKEGLERHNCPYDDRLIVWGPLTLDDGYRRANELLSSLPVKPSAIIAGNDQLAIGVIRAASDRGLRVPHDLAVMGFDNIPLTAFYAPTLTTIDIPRYQMGVTAMRLLRQLIEGHEVAPVSWLSTRLIVRASTTPPDRPE